MEILLTGASGFIGSHLRQALVERGCGLRLAGRRAPDRLGPHEQWLAIDLARPDAARWRETLICVDVVVNAVGILRESGGQTFEALHVRGPRVLFEACVAAGVRRVVQVSALGADAAAESRYHLSKRAGDSQLRALPIEGIVVQPSLVFGAGGASARLFLSLATLPVLPLQAGGTQHVQPIHISDVVDALVRLVLDPSPPVPDDRTVALVGPAPVTLAAYLQALRAGLGMSRAGTLNVPAAWVAAAAALGSKLRSSALDRDTWGMLQRGNTAPVEATWALLGRMPRPPDRFIDPDDAADRRRLAQLQWLMPLLRIAIAMVWIATGIVSLGVYPVAESEALLARAGVGPALAPWALAGAAGLDLALGIATLAWPRRWLWRAQAALILLYIAIITWRLPEYWVHPYGPLVKNLPMLAALWLLDALDPGKERR